jgi:hypothetical protein
MDSTRPVSTRMKRGFDSWICGFVSWSSSGCSLGWITFSESMVLFIVVDREQYLEVVSLKMDSVQPSTDITTNISALALAQ